MAQREAHESQERELRNTFKAMDGFLICPETETEGKDKRQREAQRERKNDPVVSVVLMDVLFQTEEQFVFPPWMNLGQKGQV